ncbi:MAG TPA: 5'-nucleotidase [Pyrinomonadaceae bacterium]|jgi:2',3'-cyclic-nucleotide 2'-phosphodiesterase (5'-nucleotidase family)|nr:5'-nucleotidase [Pyrinomonadaceae bacterium]
MFGYANRYASCAALLLGLCLLVGAATIEARAQQAGATAPPPQPARTPATSSSAAAGGGSSSSSSGTQQTPAESATAPSRAPLNINVRATERAVDATVPDDPAVEAVIAPYSAKVRELNAPIGKLAGNLKKGGMGGGSLGNFVADALRSRAEAQLGKPVLLAVINSSGLRKNQITEGAISASDIFELLPFENALVTLDLTGVQLRRFLEIAVARRDAQSGARILYRTNKEQKKNELVSVKLRGAGGVETEIDPNATYSIVTIDYLVKRGGDYIILQQGANLKPLTLTMRDAVLDYVKAETAAGRVIKATLDGRFSYDRSGSATEATEDEQP